MVVSTDVIQSLNPADESVIEEVPVTPSDRVGEVLEQAARAQESWADRPLEQRVNLVEEAARTMEKRSDELARCMTEEQGKPLSESRAEVLDTVQRIHYFCENVSSATADEVIPVNSDVTGVVQHRPLGVVAGIKPWNFPVSIPIWSVVPALLTGNTYVLKPSELTPVTGRKVVECFPGELHERNVLNLVQGSGEVGRQLVESELVDYVAFVGSRETGKWIYQSSAPHIRDLGLELGGKDPMVVLDDADPDAVYEGALHGAFKNCGQVCCGIERLILPESMADSLIERLIEGVRSLRVDNGLEPGTDVGPMVRGAERERVKEHLRDAEERGADIYYSKNLPDQQKGFWQAPALVTEVSTEMTLLNEETFGPVLPVLTYGDEEEAVREANRLDFGLGASVYGQDPRRAGNVADRIEAGSIGINQVVGSIVQLPWGGVKKSGVGRMLGIPGLRKFTERTVLRWNPDQWEQSAEEG